jgi:hypothetical protein
VIRLERKLERKEELHQTAMSVLARAQVDDKMEFITGLEQEWFAAGEEKGVFDPRSREGMELRTSYTDN